MHRSDGSGTTFIFTDYLSKVSPEWKAKVGRATSVEWPVGLGGKGNEGVTQQVKQTEGAIGYVELIYAMSNGLPYAEIKNAGGQFVEPTLKTRDRGGRGRASSSPTPTSGCRSPTPRARMRTRSRRSPGCWCTRQNRDAPRPRRITAFLGWMLEPEAQRMAADLHYAPLPGAGDRADRSSGSRRVLAVTDPLQCVTDRRTARARLPA